MHGLLVKSPWVEKILNAQKTWEIRGTATKIRGPIALIKSGTGTIVGTCEIVNCIGPLNTAEFNKNENKHLVSKDFQIRYKKIYAWIIKNPQKISPIPYRHPNGAVIWVRLSDPLLK